MAFDKNYNMEKKLETKVARKAFGMVSVGERLVLVGGQLRDTTLGGLGLYEYVGYVPSRKRRQIQNVSPRNDSPQFFINVNYFPFIYTLTYKSTVIRKFYRLKK